MAYQGPQKGLSGQKEGQSGLQAQIEHSKLIQTTVSGPKPPKPFINSLFFFNFQKQQIHSTWNDRAFSVCLGLLLIFLVTSRNQELSFAKNEQDKKR